MTHSLAMKASSSATERPESIARFSCESPCGPSSLQMQLWRVTAASMVVLIERSSPSMGPFERQTASHVPYSASPMSEDPRVLLYDIERALSLSQRELATIIGSSRSTVQRFHAGRNWLSSSQFEMLTRAVFPKDQALAERAADQAGTTLEAMGLRAPAPPPPIPVVAPPVPPARPPSPHVAESVLCAAAEAMNLPPQAVRAALRAASRSRARSGAHGRDGGRRVRAGRGRLSCAGRHAQAVLTRSGPWD